MKTLTKLTTNLHPKNICATLRKLRFQSPLHASSPLRHSPLLPITYYLLPIACLLLLLLPLHAQEAPPQKKTPGIPKIITLLDPVEDVDSFLPSDASQAPHILFINVANALPQPTFREAVAYLRMRYNIKVAATTERKPFALDIVKDTANLKKRFGNNALIVVAVVNQETGPSFINIPGFFSQVNMRGLDKDNPSDHFLKKRRTQMICRGLAHACGVGSTLDSTCVMRSGSFTLTTMDEVSATYGPVAYFSLTSFLREISQGELFTQ